MPGSVMTFGSTWCRRSTTNRTIMAAVNSRRGASSGWSPRASCCARKRTAVAISTSGYSGSIGA